MPRRRRWKYLFVKVGEKERALKRHHPGFTGKDYAKLAREQENRCAICNKMQISDYKWYLFIDHDHKTGKVRGLLCGNCNTLLGMAGDNIEILQSAIEYLKNKS